MTERKAPYKTKKPQLVPQSEAAFTAAVIEAAHALGWIVHHCRPGRTAKGWTTPIQGDKGFPDLVMVRKHRLIFAELKGIDVRERRGKLSFSQSKWILALARTKAEFYEWWPDSEWQKELT